MPISIILVLVFLVFLLVPFVLLVFVKNIAFSFFSLLNNQVVIT